VLKRLRFEKGKQPESSLNLFVSQNASHKFSVIYNKHVISSRTVLLADFEHLNLANILNTSSLEYLAPLRNSSALSLCIISNLTFQNNHIRSRALGKDINISLD